MWFAGSDLSGSYDAGGCRHVNNKLGGVLASVSVAVEGRMPVVLFCARPLDCSSQQCKKERKKRRERKETTDRFV